MTTLMTYSGEVAPDGDVPSSGSSAANRSWLQADETPRCPGCGDPMKFVAQPEEATTTGPRPSSGSAS